jgi:chromosome segregation ATPase
MPNRPPDRVYSLAEDNARDLDQRMLGTYTDAHKLSQRVSALQVGMAQRGPSQTSTSIHQFGPDLKQLSQDLIRHADDQENLSDQTKLKEALENHQQLLEEYLKRMEDEEQENKRKTVAFHEKKQEFEGVISIKKAELEKVIKSERAVSDARRKMGTTSRLRRKQIKEMPPPKEVISSAQRQREKSRMALEKDIFHTSKRFLHFLVSEDHRSRGQVAIVDDMLQDPSSLIARFSSEALEDLQAVQQRLGRSKAEKERELQAVKTKIAELENPDSIENKTLLARQQALKSSVGKATQALGQAGSVFNEITPLCENFKDQVGEQIRLYRSGALVDPALKIRRAENDAEEALNVAAEVIAEAKASKARIDKALDGVLTESQANADENAKLKKRLEELLERIADLLNQIESLKKEKAKTEGEKENSDRDRNRLQRVSDEEREDNDDERKRWKSRERDLLNALEDSRRDLLNTKTELSIIAQAPTPAPAQAPIIIHPPAAPAAPMIDLAPLLAAINALGALITDRSAPAQSPPIVVNSPAADNSALLLILQSFMDKMGTIPEAIRQLNQQTSAPDTGLIQENKDLDKLLAERDGQLKTLHDEIVRFRGEANSFYGYWQEALTSNAELRTRIQELELTLSESIDTIDNLRKALRTALRERNEARTERDEVRGQRDTYMDEKDKANDGKRTAEKERDKANTAKTTAEGERDKANVAKTKAEKERDKANTRKEEAERARDAANDAKKEAEKERDAANGGKDTSDGENARLKTERNQANNDKRTAERERDEARGKLKEADRTIAAGRTSITRYERDNENLRGRLSEKDSKIAELERLLAEARSSATVVVTTTSDNGPGTAKTDLNDRFWTSSSSERRQAEEVKLEMIDISQRLQSLEFIARSLDLSAKESIRLIAHSIPDLDFLREVFIKMSLGLHENEFTVKDRLFCDEKGSGKRIFKWPLRKISSRKVPVPQISDEESVLFALAQSLQEHNAFEKADQKKAPFIGRGRSKEKTFDVHAALENHLSKDRYDRIIKRIQSGIMADGGRPLIKSLTERTLRTDETALERILSLFMPKKDSRGVQILGRIKSVRMQYWQGGQRSDLNSEKELREIKRGMVVSTT